jgi:nicotinamide-nucleotide amidase
MTSIKNNAGPDRIRSISVFGLTEPAAIAQLNAFQQKYSHLKLDVVPKFPEIRINLSTVKPDVINWNESISDAVQWVCSRLDPYAFSTTGESLEEVVGKLLRVRNATLAVAESCTGGLIANMLTDVPGSSDYFLFSAVTYANEAKVKILDVKSATLEKHGAVSEQTAAEMACGVRKVVNATYGIATSGIAGPDGGTADKPVGTVCIGLAAPSSISARRFRFIDYSRLKNKQIFAAAALDMLRKELMKKLAPI